MGKDKKHKKQEADGSANTRPTSRAGESVLPTGWAEEFFEKADFERSFAGLEGCSHFQADVMRGRIRSLQLRLDEARGYFERALAGALSAPRTIPNTIRRLVLHAYWFEDALLQGPVTEKPDPDWT
jgi:hypothetical protein